MGTKLYLDCFLGLFYLVLLLTKTCLLLGT